MGEFLSADIWQKLWEQRKLSCKVLKNNWCRNIHFMCSKVWDRDTTKLKLVKFSQSCVKTRNRAIHFVVLKVWDWNSISVKLSCETNIFLFSWESDINENGSLKNYQNLLQKRWWSVEGNFPHTIKHISHSVGILINKIVIFGFLRKLN